jgi:hypothetical protein
MNKLIIIWLILLTLGMADLLWLSLQSSNRDIAIVEMINANK